MGRSRSGCGNRGRARAVPEGDRAGSPVARDVGRRTGAIHDPGQLGRRASLQGEARRTVLIAVGTAPWLVLAGIVEGNRANLANAGLGAVIGVGAGLGALFWGLVLWRGALAVRSEPSTWLADTP